MKFRIIIFVLSALLPISIWADDHSEYITFRNSAKELIGTREYKEAESKLEGAEFFATSQSDKSDLMNVRNYYRRQLHLDVDSARTLFRQNKYEECIQFLLPLQNTIKDKDIQWWIGNSYARLNMPKMALDYLKTGTEKYNDNWCAYSLANLYRNHKGVGSISRKRLIELYEIGANETTAALDSLGTIYTESKDYSEAFKYYQKSKSNYSTIKICHLILDGEITLVGGTTEALKYLQKAATANDARSLYNLGMAHYMGEFGLPKNHAKGYDLVRQASRLGYSKAKTDLRKMTRY